MTDTDPRCPEILALREQGYSWDRIGQHFGMSYSTARALVDPEYARKRKARKAARERRYYGRENAATYSHLFPQGSNRVNPEVVKARLAEIPPDDRDRTAVLMGDPPYRRSALYQRNQA